jgi:hypothetical protein
MAVLRKSIAASGRTEAHAYSGSPSDAIEARWFFSNSALVWSPSIAVGSGIATSTKSSPYVTAAATAVSAASRVHFIAQMLV